MGFLLFSTISQANAIWMVNMAPGVAEVSRFVFDLHIAIFWICVVISVLVFGATFQSMIVHRRPTGQRPTHFHESATVEILWTAVPFMILVVMAVPATRALIHTYDISEPELDVRTTGYQWKWQYKYLGQDVGYLNNLITPQDQIHNRQVKDEHYPLEVDEPLVLPVGIKVRLLIISSNVTHSWWVSAFAVKCDTIPDFISKAWARVDGPGIYRGQCVKLCGKDHGFMPIVVDVKPKAEFNQQLAKCKEEAAKIKGLTSKEWTKEELVARGDKVYHTICAACHQAESQGMLPIFPALKDSKIVTGPKEHHLEVVFNGVPDIAMAAFGKQFNEADSVMVITYERNAWDDDGDDMVTPKDVVAYKQRQQQEIAVSAVINTPNRYVGDHHRGPAKGLMRWVLTTNHKDIGTLYLWFGFMIFLLGSSMVIVIRAEPFQLSLQIVEPALFNQMTTMHGLIMVFDVVVSAFVGLANWMIPLMVDASDMALSRMNNFSPWLLPATFGLLASILFMPGDGPNFGWTFYVPLSTISAPHSATFFIFATYLTGISSIIGAISTIATILNLYIPDVIPMKVSLPIWTWLITAFLLIVVMPVLAGMVTMMLMNIHLGTNFFNVASGGDPVLFQHVFQFLGHPEVYIMALPAFGAVSAIISTFACKPLFDYTPMVYATASIAFPSFMVQAHHMSVAGTPVTGELFFIYTTMLIAMPTRVKVLNWVITMWEDSLTFEAPMLFTAAFVVLFAIGGFFGLILATVPTDFQYHDTYSVVAHFHYVLVPGATFGIFVSAYYWLPKWTDHMYDETLGKLRFRMNFISMNLAFFPMHLVGLADMPRRVPNYDLQFADSNMVSSIDVFMFSTTQLLLLFIVIKCIHGGESAPAKPWDGIEGLEWNIPSPAPYRTFSIPSEVG